MFKKSSETTLGSVLSLPFIEFIQSEALFNSRAEQMTERTRKQTACNTAYGQHALHSVEEVIYFGFYLTNNITKVEH